MSGDAAAAVQAGGDAQQQQAVGGNRIQVSSSKKPLFFYVNLAKVYIGPSIHRSALASRCPPSSPMAVVSWLVLILVGLRFVQKYMQQHGDVELSALGLGASPSSSHPLSCIFLIPICKPDLTKFCLWSCLLKLIVSGTQRARVP